MLPAGRAMGTEIPAKLTPDAVRALVADPSFTDYQGLTRALERSPERDLKIFSYQWIANANKLEAFEPFITAYKAETNPLVKMVLFNCLGSYASRTKRIENWNGTGSPHVPQLEADKQNQFLELLNEAAKPTSPAMLRVSAIHRMGELRLPGSAEYLLAATKDSAPEVRRAALGSIRFIGGPEHQEFWKQRLQEQDPELRAIAVEQLGGLDDPTLDKPLEQVAAGQDTALAESAKMHLELRGHRRDIQKKMERALNPTKPQLALSVLVNATITHGWQAVMLLLLPCLLGAGWAIKNGDKLSTGVALFALILTPLAWSSTSKAAMISPATALLLATIGAVIAAVPLVVRLVRRTSATPLFDASIPLGLGVLFAPMVFRSSGMELYLTASAFFGVVALCGGVRALLALKRGDAAVAAHCIVYSYMLALLLGCMPYAFIGM